MPSALISTLVIVAFKSPVAAAVGEVGVGVEAEAVVVGGRVVVVGG